MRTDLPQRMPRPGLHRFAVLVRGMPPATPGATWLELGGGAGEFSDLAIERGYEVTLVDGDPRNIANVKTRGISGLVADLNEPLTPLGDDTFNGVSLIEVVEHVPRAELLLREAHRVLKPGGLMLLSTPNAVWWRARLRVLFGRAIESEGYHYRFFTVQGTRRLCEDAGFIISQMRFSSPAFGYNWVSRRLLRRKTRKHLPVPRPLAGLFAQTTYVVGVRPR